MGDFAYVRVSSSDQNTSRQLVDTGVQFDKTFTDRSSGGSTDRPGLERLKDHLREGDTVHVHSIDRLARNLNDLRQLIAEWRSNGISVRFHKEGLIFNAEKDATPMDTLLLSMLGAVAEFERAIIRERQAEGIAKAKAEGKYKGGALKKLKPEVKDQVKSDLASGLSFRKTADKNGISLSSVQRISKEA